MEIELLSTKTTPLVLFKEGHILIEGKSIPVADAGFYNSLVSYTNKYAINPAPVTLVDIDFEYINAYSKKSMIQFFTILESMHSKGNKIQINWYYKPDDEAMLELGKIYQALFTIPFNFCSR